MPSREGLSQLLASDVQDHYIASIRLLEKLDVQSEGLVLSMPSMVESSETVTSMIC